jgi:hypothetical protein
LPNLQRSRDSLSATTMARARTGVVTTTAIARLRGLEVRGLRATHR